MPAQARISIMRMCQNTYNNEVVAKALRQSIGEKELVTLDAWAPRETSRHGGNSGVTADEHGEPELEDVLGRRQSLRSSRQLMGRGPVGKIDEDTLDNIRCRGSR